MKNYGLVAKVLAVLLAIMLLVSTFAFFGVRL